ncbi:GntR family transcriptional regulator [Streptomyces sp. NPDC014685]|uniref:GntR family transcriptional regulator n=1 Tax=Streptomyces sp. NPDC014685 TaxID=3364881 RepID=UPI0037018640
MTESQLSRCQKVATYYESKILSGELRPGDELPARRDIMKEHGEGGRPLGRATADKAIDILAARGLIVRRHRKSPVIADRAAFGKIAGNALEIDETSRILLDGATACPSDIATHLSAKPGDQVQRCSWVNFKGGEPVTMSTRYCRQEAAQLAPELSGDASNSGGSRKPVAERVSSLPPKGPEAVTARLASDEERDALSLRGTYAVVTQVMRIIPSEDGRADEVVIKVCSGAQPLLFQADFKG